MKLIIQKVATGLTLSLVLTLVFVPQLFAKDGETTVKTDKTTTTEPSSEPSGKKGSDSSSTRQAETPKKTETKKSDAVESPKTETKKKDDAKTEEHREVAREKLDDKKKALCEDRQAVVNTAIDDVRVRSKNHFDRITTIYGLTTKFYAEKGLSVSNYDELVAKVETTKAAAAAANETLTSVPDFSCDSDGPKADIQAFRNKRLDKVDAMGAYRDAVRALVKAVRDAAKATKSETTKTEGAN